MPCCMVGTAAYQQAEGCCAETCAGLRKKTAVPKGCTQLRPVNPPTLKIPHICTETPLPNISIRFPPTAEALYTDRKTDRIFQ